MVRFVRNGWYFDSYRHSLAARGILTSKRLSFDPRKYSPADDIEVGEVEEQEGDGGSRKRKIRGISPLVNPGKIQRAKATDILSKEKVLEPFDQRLSRLRSGISSDAKQLLEDYKDDEFRQQAIKDAVFQGASENIRRGEGFDRGLAKEAGLSNERIKNLDDQYRLAGGKGRGFYTGAAKRVVGGVGGAAVGATGKVLESAETIGAVGLKNMMEADSQPSKSAYQEMIEADSRRKLEQVATKGVFNPLRIAGIDVDALEAKNESKKKIYVVAERAKQETESFFNNKDKLARIDLSGFNKGNIAFQSGSRDKLIDAITDLEAEHGKIKDRWNMLQDTRRLVLSPDNRDQTIHKAAHQGGVFPSIVFGSGGADEISRETEKISQVERKLKDSSNILSARIGILRNKLRRMNSVIPPSTDAPANVKLVGEGASSGGNFFNINVLGNALDANKGKFKSDVV